MPASTERAAVASVPRELRREVVQIAVLGAAMLLVGSLLVWWLEGPFAMVRALLGGFVGWGFVLWQCQQRLHLNERTSDNQVFTTLGAANRITLLRGWLIAATAGCLVMLPGQSHTGWLYGPAVLYSLAALLDGLDGMVARRQNRATRLGAELDTALDAFGLLVAPLFAVLTGKLPVAYLLVSLAYYLFQGGIRWRQQQGRPVHPLPPSRVRRYLAGAQMVLVAVALWPPVPAGATQLAGIVLMIPLLFGFCRDWLHVSGRLGVQSESAS